MALFDRVEQIPANEVPALLPDPDGAWIGPLQPGISYSEYQAMAERVLRLIGAGDIYLANLTFHGHVATEGDPLALYAKLRGAAGAGWGAVVHTRSEERRVGKEGVQERLVSGVVGSVKKKNKK